MPLRVVPRDEPMQVRQATGRDQTTHWWLMKPGTDRAAQIYRTVRQLEQEQAGRRQQSLLHMNMYSNGNVAGEGLKGTLRWQQTQPIRLRMNLANAVCDALVAKIAKLRPRPRFITIGGDWGARKRAEAAEAAIDGEFYRNQIDDIGPLVGLDAFVDGTGFFHVRRDGCGYPIIERAAPGEVIIGYYDGLYQKPRTMYRAWLRDREELLDQYGRDGKIAEGIRAATESAPNYYPWLQAKRQSGDMVWCIEAWHKATGGRHQHTFVIGTVEIPDPDWDGERFPLVPYRWSDRQFGYWGKGVVEEITPFQIEINYTLEKIQHILHNVSTVRYWVQAGAGNKIEFNANRATNFPGEWLKYYGMQPPVKEATDSIPPEMWTIVDRSIQAAYRLVGLNENFASATKPVGLNSGEAQRVYEDVGDARMLLKGRGYEQAHMDLARVLIDVKREIASSKTEKESPIVVKRKRARGMTVKNLSFKDWDPEKLIYQMQLLEQSALPGTPSGKTATVQEWLQMGLITPDEGKELLNMPDIKAELTMSLATKDSVLSAVEAISDDGEYVAPHPMLDLQLAARLAVASYTRLEWEGLQDDRLEMLAIYIDEIKNLTQAAMPPAPIPEAGAPMGTQALPGVAGQMGGVPLPPT